jgi:predicted transcriptional regulator
MEKTTLYLPVELHRALKDAARREGRPQAVLIRQAISEYLDTRSGPPRLRSLGAGEDEGLRARDAEAWLESEWSSRP